MIQNFTTYRGLQTFQIWRWATSPDFSPRRGGLRAGPQRWALEKFARIFGPPKWRKHSDAQEGLALRSRWLWRHFFTWPRCRPMRTGIQCCRFVQVPERPTLTPRYFFLRCSIRHAIGQWPSNLVMIRRGVILPPGFSLTRIFFLRRWRMNIPSKSPSSIP